MILIIALLCFSVLSAEPVLIVNGHYEGTADICWSLYDDGSFVVEGNGEIPSFDDSKQLPYIEIFEKDIVKSLIIKEGITEIGDYVFFGCSAGSVEIASTVKKIGDFSFYGMKNTQSVHLSKNITSVGESAFSCCENLKISVDTNNNRFIADEYGIIYNYSKSEVIFCPVNSDLSDYIFPSSLTYIRNNAFNGVKNLKKISFPESLKSIGVDSFKNCMNLESLIMNYGIENIETGAFENCINLREIYYCGTETSLANISMDGCGFYKSSVICDFCRHIDTTVLPSLVATCKEPGYTESVYCNDCRDFVVPKKIITETHTDTDSDNVCNNCGDEYCLAIDAGFCCENNCDIIWVIYDNGNLVLYGNGEMKDYTVSMSPFYKYRDSITTLTLSGGITSIGDYCFYDMPYLERISGGENVISVGKGAFENSFMLNNIKSISNLEIVKDKAFKNCSLSAWDFDTKIKSIGIESFYGCNFNEVRLSDSVESIGDRAFYSCKLMESFFIGHRVSLIGEDAFGNCDSLCEISADKFNNNFSTTDDVLFGIDQKELIKYPPALSSDAYHVPEGTEVISYGAFCGCKNLRMIVLNDELATIDDYAFSYCSSLTDIDIPFSVRAIGNSTFSNCTELKNISLGISLISIGKFAFSDCPKLKEIVILSEVTKISEGTFYNCIGLEKIKLGASVNTIEKDAFGLCDNLFLVLCEDDENIFGLIEVDESGNEFFNSAAKHFTSHTVTESPEILPSCVYSGYTAGKYCNQCKLYLTGHEEIKSEFNEHSIGNYILFKQSTCTDEGEERAFCVRECGYYVKRSVGLKDHKYNSSIVWPTCTDIGYKIYTCSCGDSYSGDYTEPTGHTLSDYYTVTSPKCITTGIERADCTDCNYYTERIVAAKGHSFRLSSIIKPTCTTDGYSIYKCSCGVSKKSDITDKLGHSFNSSFTTDKKVSCVNEGSKSRHCKRCGAKTDIKAIKKTSHSYKFITTKATLKKNGNIKKTCSYCGKVSSTETIYKIKSVRLSATTYVYDKKTHKPEVIVKNSKGKTLKAGTDYTVKYQSGSKKTGKHTVKIKFKEKYSGSETLSFKIIPQNVKSITSAPSLNSIKLSWNKVKGATGYTVYYYNSKKKKYVAIKDTKNLSYIVSKINGKAIKNGTDYKFAVKAYSDNSGEKVYSSKSKKHSTATKPSKANLKTPEASDRNITVKWQKMNCDGYELVYATNKSFSSKKTVTIKKASATKSVIKGATKGKTYFIKIRAYKIIAGKKVYGYYSNVKKVTVK